MGTGTASARLHCLAQRSIDFFAVLRGFVALMSSGDTAITIPNPCLVYRLMN